jgi:hypothetical protein
MKRERTTEKKRGKRRIGIARVNDQIDKKTDSDSVKVPKLLSLNKRPLDLRLYFTPCSPACQVCISALHDIFY